MPVVTLVLYYGEEDWDGPMCLHDMLDIPEEIKKYINDYRLNIIQIKDNNLQLHNEKNKDLFKIMSIIYDIKKSKEERREELRKYEERRKISESVVDVVVATTNTKIKVTVRGRFMRNRINRIITYRIPEQASISEADFHRLATRICEGTEQIRNFLNYLVFKPPAILKP